MTRVTPHLADVDRRLLHLMAEGRWRPYGRPPELGRSVAGFERDEFRVGTLVDVAITEEALRRRTSGQGFQCGVQGIVQRNIELFVVQLVQGFHAVFVGWPDGTGLCAQLDGTYR